MNDNLEKLLECEICLIKYEEPKVLDCQHIFCKHCLERLVTQTRVGRHYKIACPVCRKISKVPNGDVANLPSNYLINRLLDFRSTANSKPSCGNHEGKILKLFCLTCQQLICRDCTLIDHRGHNYDFAKHVFPGEKEKILNAMRESNEKILTLEASMDDFEEQKKSLDQNAKEIKQKIDDFCDETIQFLKKEKQRLKDDLQESVKTQKEKLYLEMRYFLDSLDYVKQRLGVTEHILAKVSDEDALLAKNEILKQLDDINCVLPHLMPTPLMKYDFGSDDMLDVINKIEASSLQ